MAKLHVLRGIPVFQGLSDRELAAILRIVSEQTVGPGVTLFRQHTPADSLFIIKTGGVEILRNGEPILRLGPRELLSETGILGGGEHLVSARTHLPSELLVLASEDLQALSKSEPATVLHLLTALQGQFLRKVQEALPSLLPKSP